jgi:hypothetical protein
MKHHFVFIILASVLATLSGCGKCSQCTIAGGAGLHTDSAIVTLDDLDESYDPFPDIAVQRDGFSKHLAQVTRRVVEGWITRVGYSVERSGKPRVIVTEFENDTDLELTEAELRQLFNQIADNDGRFYAVLATAKTERAKSYLRSHLLDDPYFSNNSLSGGRDKALQCLATLRLSSRKSSGERLSDKVVIDLTLYDIENHSIAVSDWDVLDKRECMPR